MKIYERVKKIADSKGMNIAEVERGSGFNSSIIKNWKKSTPSVENLFAVSDHLEVDPRFLYKGEIKSYNLPAEHLELLNHYEKLSVEKQRHYKGLLKTEVLEIEQGLQKLEEEKAELEQKVRKEEEKKFILEMLSNEADESFIKKVTGISDKEFELIKKQFDKKQKRKNNS